MNQFLQKVSKVSKLPILSRLAPPVNHVPSAEELEGFLESQRLAERATAEIAGMMREGWTEQYAAGLLETALRDNGVHAFFHFPFAWFGERTRFDKISSYAAFGPSRRVLLPGDVFILDVAPIYRGFACDIGYTASFGENPELKTALGFLKELRTEIPKLFSTGKTGGEIFGVVEDMIVARGYDVVHRRYPMSVLGHRIHSGNPESGPLRLWNFGWQSYWSLMSRGFFGQLFNEHYQGDLIGLWAIEPHLGAKTFGAKFEEILVVERDKVYWLETNR